MTKNKLIFILLLLLILAISTVFFKFYWHNSLKENNSTNKTTSYSEHKKVPLKIKLHKEMIGNFDGFTLLKEVLNKHYYVEFVEKDYDLLLDGPGYHHISKKQKTINKKFKADTAIKIQYTWENEAPHLDMYDLSIGFEILDHPKYFRLPLYYMWHGHNMHKHHKFSDCRPDKKKYFACFLVGNPGKNKSVFKGLEQDGAQARTRLFHMLSLYKDVQSGGRYLNNIGGPVPSKQTMEWLSNCKFVISYENQMSPGYITEKSGQSYLSGSMPLYNGHESVFEDINKKSVIYSGDFATEEELVEYVKKVDNDDELYCKIWRQKMFDRQGKSYDDMKKALAEKMIPIIDTKLKNNKTW